MNSFEKTLPPADEDRLLAAVQEYQSAIEAGRRPDRAEFLQRYPDLADLLAECLDGLELVRAAVPQLHPPAPPAPPPEVEGAQAQPLGDFRIVREIGRGGMGIVYEAVQLSLGRRVALKVLPLAATLDAKHLQRFHREAQAAAQLHHTNIVPVHGVGCERGVHYYAMQLIEGQSLAETIRHLRQQDGRDEDESQATASRPTAGRTAPWHGLERGPSAETAGPFSVALSTQRSERQDRFFRTAAQLIAQAADALEHAHQFGIVHRDIKPANLLVDHAGRLWVTDFGLAQFHAETGLTRTGDLLGTLRYMSPEQAAGQRVLLDHRTDIYSLGATLYELVTLEPIFPGRTSHELLRQILHDEPRPPRKIEPTVPVELETIILKAVSKSPADRYGSARELAEDLRRYLEDRPILARRPSLLERARKWSRRHPSIVGAGVLFLVLCVVGLLINNAMISSEQKLTRGALEREQLRAEEAEARFRLARRSVDEMIELSEVELADRPGMEGLRKRLLMSALVYYQEFIDQRADDPDALAELRETKARVEHILDDLAVLQGVGRMHLLGQSAVLDDLGVSDEKRAEIETLTKRQRERGMELFRQFGKLSPEERSRRFLEQARADDAAVAAVLTPAQLRRLRQIAMQQRGVGAFREPDIAAQLMLSAEQRKRLRTIESDLFLGPPGGGMRPGQSMDAFRKANEKRQQGALERALAVLTPEQTRLWQGMTGPPFRGPLNFRPPFGPPPGPPPGTPTRGGRRPGHAH